MITALIITNICTSSLCIPGIQVLFSDQCGPSTKLQRPSGASLKKKEAIGKGNSGAASVAFQNLHI